VTDLNLLVIAPEAPGQQPLGWLRELGNLSAIEGVKLQLVGGNQANEPAIAQALRTNRDVVIWSGHGEPNGLVMSDGGIVDGQWLATQAKCGAPRVMVIAACGSAVKDVALQSVTQYVSRAGINAVGMPLGASDKGAIEFNTEFVRALVAGADIGTAYEVASNHARRTAPALAQGLTLTPGLTNGYRAIMQRMDEQDRRLEGMDDTQRAILARLETLESLMRQALGERLPRRRAAA